MATMFPPEDREVNERLSHIRLELQNIITKVQRCGGASLNGAERGRVGEVALLASRFPTSDAAKFMYYLKVAALEHTYKKPSARKEP